MLCLVANTADVVLCGLAGQLTVVDIMASRCILYPPAHIGIEVFLYSIQYSRARSGKVLKPRNILQKKSLQNNS